MRLGSPCLCTLSFANALPDLVDLLSFFTFFFACHPSRISHVVRTSLRHLDVSAPLVIRPSAEFIVKPPLSLVRLPVDYDVPSQTSAASSD